LRELLLASSIRILTAGARLYAQGDYASSVFAVLAGEAQLTDGAGLQLPVRAGEVLGEMALVSGRPHETDAIVMTLSAVLEIPHAAITRLLRAEATVRSYIDTLYALRALRILLLPHAAAATVHALSQDVQLHRVKSGEALFAQGDPAERLYIV